MSSTLVTGALGQIGTDLVTALRARGETVVSTDLAAEAPDDDGPYATLDVRDGDRLNALLDEHDVSTVYHLASLLSATGEQKPDLAWDVNLGGLRHVLVAAKRRALRVFWPSSIAVFGPTTPQTAPQRTILEPTTMYGLTKVAGELLCQYAHLKDGVDVRSLRYPGLISYSAPPGGGTTDFAVEIFHKALASGRFSCFVGPETRLPLMYMPDAVRATLALMDAPAEKITVRTSYNVAAFSPSAAEVAATVRKRVPRLVVTYAPDFRQQIADSWPQRVKDDCARRDWGWAPAYDLDAMTEDMLTHLQQAVDAR